MMPFAGETLPLSLQLWDFDPNKFPRVHLKDENGVTLSGSPFDMIHIGQGKYTNKDVVMPSGVLYIEATYEVFASASDRTAGTPQDPNYTSATDVFRLEIPDQIIVDKLDLIIQKLDGLALPGASIKVEIDSNEIETMVDDLKEIKALVERDEEAKVKVSQNDINVVTSDDEVDTKIDC